MGTYSVKEGVETDGTSPISEEGKEDVEDGDDDPENEDSSEAVVDDVAIGDELSVECIIIIIMIIIVTVMILMMEAGMEDGFSIGGGNV